MTITDYKVYKGYDVVLSTTIFAGSLKASPAMFSVAKKGEWDAVHSGTIEKVFDGGGAALDAARDAARAWIDANGLT